MDVAVFVWVSLIKAKSPGHAALQIGNGLTHRTGYVSFAPQEGGSISGAGRFYDKAHDDAHYKGRGLWKGSIVGLDAEAMMKQIFEDVAQNPSYGPRNECATTVWRYLRRGGGDKYASKWARTALFIVTPDDLEDYARSIVHNTKGSTEMVIPGEGTARSLRSKS